ncbi:SDR family oxidoreductase [Corynebacterium marinum]|uniref:Short chain dehydrogenase n=1 Tax=Corynebacterium marinum DSM 44953 TaxID=1224162 RepID=A0A0B6TTG8_9CORY|nr:SDR family oxidoreductase [Corynebacterium marinum]AJK69559.1 short chain dehydrogenase [Corynebacterium marinum DSM 44953]GGO20456.1 short chain dehydrogenase [Corynebacterium marinum]
MTTEAIAIVTGATGGMGREIVAELARTHHVYALGRNDDALAELGALSNVTPVSTDLVTDLLGGTEAPSPVARLLDLTRIDVVVHAAAVATKFSVESARVADWRTALDINVVVPAELTRRVLPALRAARGTVVFINSGAGRGSYGDNIVYAATKHALYAVADGLRKAESGAGVRVSTVAPGPTDTPMLERLQAQSGAEYVAEHYIEPVEVARAVRTVVDAGPSAQITDISVRPRIEVGDRKPPRG